MKKQTESEEKTITKDFISFHTLNKWTSSDVITLVASISGIYNAFLAKQMAKKIWVKVIPERSYAALYEAMHETMSEKFGYFHLLKELKNLPYEKLTYFPISLSQYEVFTKIDDYASDAEKLSVHHIHIASPGIISFEGLGDAIKESKEFIRDFIKDFSYRNRQEKELAEAHIKERKLYNKKMELDFELYKKNVGYFLELKRLEEEKKLRNISENIDVSELLDDDDNFKSKK